MALSQKAVDVNPTFSAIACECCELIIDHLGSYRRKMKRIRADYFPGTKAERSRMIGLLDQISEIEIVVFMPILGVNLKSAVGQGPTRKCGGQLIVATSLRVRESEQRFDALF